MTGAKAQRADAAVEQTNGRPAAEPQSAAMPSPFTPIADYAFLSDCHTGALIAPDGAVDWLCVPRFDSPSVFGSLLDRGAGSFRLGPFGLNHPVSRVYEPGTNTLVTTWRSRSGWVVVRDALAMGPRRHEDTITPHTRPPADDDADHLLVRTVECVDGDVEVELVCEPVFDYGREPADWSLWRRPPRRRRDRRGQTIRLQTDMAARDRGQPGPCPARPQEGEQLYCSLSWAEELAAPADARRCGGADRRHDALLAHWVDRARMPDHQWREPIQRSALAIKGLTFMPTGATVAALTTSLPETPGGERNWDYRYTWIRDSTFTLQALHWLNLDWEADEFMQFVADLEPNERRLAADHVRHRRPPRPHRDDARRPLRLRRARARCASATARSTSARTTSTAPRWTRSCCTPAAASGCRGGCGRSSKRRPRARRVWREPDQGIWEARGEPQHYVSSKLMCWVAMDRAAKLAEIRGDTELAGSWAATAEEIKADILEHGVDARGVLRQHYDTEALDASTLLAAIFGFLPGDDERLRASVLAIAGELTEHGFVLRYKTGETDDGLSGKEGTFLICSFWLVSALAIIGELSAPAI